MCRGDYVVELVVHDGAQKSAPDTVTVTADDPQANNPPFGNPYSLRTGGGRNVTLTMPGYGPAGNVCL